MSAERITLAVVGLGGIARKAHLPVVAARSDIDVVALVNRSGHGVAELAAAYRFPITATTLEQTIARRPAAALVLTTSATHADVACRLLEAGIAVYLEKPIAPDVQGARAVVECARRTGHLLMVGFNRRYAPMYRRLHEVFFDSAAGQCHLLKTRQAGGAAQSPAEAVWDDVIHLIDLSRWLMGEPTEVQAAVQRDGTGAFTGLSALLRYRDGRATTLAQPVRTGGVRERVELYGEGVSAVVTDLDVLRVQRDGRTETQGHDPWIATLERRGFTAALDHFIACVRDTEEPAQSPEDALATHVLTQTILDAAGV